MADYQRKQYLQQFHQRAQELLTDNDRDYLYQVLKEYQTYKKVDKLIQCLKSALDTPQKMDLLRDVRHLIPANHVAQFDSMAPYHKMAHPYTVPNQVKNRPKSVHTHTPRPRPTRPVTAMNGHHRSHTQHMRVNGNDGGSFHVIHVNKAQEDSLGFSIRGGSEHGLGIYVSEVDGGSVAETAGLQVGDNIVEVNNVSFDNLASSSAVKVLTGSNRLKMVVRRTGKVPGMKFAKEKTTWFDTHLRKIVNDNFMEHSQKHLYSERRVNLTITKREQYLGFNIRGGSEYGLGIFVSRIDRGGLAEQKGIKEGDQLIHVNSQTFVNITHSNAVEFLKSQTQLVVTVRDVGRYPAFKELIAEYSWQGDSSIRRSRPHTAPPPRTNQDSSYESEGTITQFPMESKVEVFTQTVADEPDAFSMAIQTEEVLPEQNEIFLPEMASLFQSSQHNTLDSKKMLTLDSKKSTLDSKKSPKRLLELISPNHVDRVQSFRRPGERDPRKTARDQSKEREQSKERQPKDQKVKRSRTFKEMLFGKKNLKVKGSGSQGASLTKPKSRTPLVKKKEKEDGRKSSGEESVTPSLRSQKVFGRGMGTQMMLQEAMQSSTLGMVQDMSRKLLNEDECGAITRHINGYMRNGDVEELTSPLLAILDKPEKMLLLREVRSIIRPTDLGRFDSMVSRQELEAYAELSARVSSQSPRTPTVMRRSLNQYGPPKKTVLASVPNSRGVFHLKTKDDYEQDILRKEEMERLKQEKLRQLRQEEQDSGSDDYVPFANLHAPKLNKEFVAASQKLRTRSSWRDDDVQIEPSGLPSNRNIIFRSTFTPASAAKRSSPQSARPKSGDVELYPQIIISENTSPKTLNNSSPDMTSHDEDYHHSNSLEEAISIFTDDITDTETMSEVNLSRDSSGAGSVIQETPLYARPSPKSSDAGITPVENPKKTPPDVVMSNEMTVNVSSELKTPPNKNNGSLSVKNSPFSAESLEGDRQSNTSQNGSPHNHKDSMNSSANSTTTSTPHIGEKRASASGLYAIIKASKGELSPVSSYPTEGAVGGADSPESMSEKDTDSQYPSLTRGILRSDGTLDSKKSLNWNETIERKSITPPDSSRTNNTSPSTQNGSPDKADSSVESHIPSPGSSLSSADFRPLSSASFRSTDHPLGSDLSGHYDLASPGGSLASSRSSRSTPPLPETTPPKAETTPPKAEAISQSSQRTPHYKKKQATPPLRPLTPPFKPNSSLQQSDSESDFEYPPPPPPMSDTKTTPSPKFTPPPPPEEPPPSESDGTADGDDDEGDVFTLVLPKNRTSLGISISGGRDSKSQPQVKVEKVFPGGAAADDGTLTGGMEIISVDGESMETATHPQAVDIVRRAYNNKTKSVMTLVLKR